MIETGRSTDKKLKREQTRMKAFNNSRTFILAVPREKQENMEQNILVLLD
jgi:hypothetical protein